VGIAVNFVDDTIFDAIEGVDCSPVTLLHVATRIPRRLFGAHLTLLPLSRLFDGHVVPLALLLDLLFCKFLQVFLFAPFKLLLAVEKRVNLFLLLLRGALFLRVGETATESIAILSLRELRRCFACWLLQIECILLEQR